jgi:hypothetical protein
MALSATGASGLTAAFLPVLQASTDRQQQLNNVTIDVSQQVEAQTQQGIQLSASPSNDVAGAVLTGRGQKVDISA